MDLNELRNQIDGIDSEILKLFSRRMEVCKEVAEYKKANNLPVMQGGREKQVIENIRNNAPEELRDGAAMLFQNIMDISKCIQNKEMKYTSRLTSPKPFIPENAVKIACQGTAGAYSEAACKRFSETSPQFFIIPLRTFSTPLKQGSRFWNTSFGKFHHWHYFRNLRPYGEA